MFLVNNSFLKSKAKFWFIIRLNVVQIVYKITPIFIF